MNTSLLQSLIRSGELVLYHDYRSGSFRDFSTQGNNGTPSAGVQWEGGKQIRFPGNGVVAVADAAELQLTQGSIVVLGDFTKQVASNNLVSKRDAGGTDYAFYVGAVATNITFYDGVAERHIASSIVGSKCVACTFSSGSAAGLFVDGLSRGLFVGVSTVTVNDAPLNIGNNWLLSNGISTPLSAVVVVNRVLTATEMSVLHGELANLRWLSKKSAHATRQQAANPAEPGLVSSWVMKPNGVTLTDDIGGHNGVIGQGLTGSKGILGDQISFVAGGSIANGNVGSIKTVEFTVLPSTTTEELLDLDGGTHTVEVTAGTITATGFAAPIIYVNGVASTALIAGAKQHVVVTTDTAFVASAFVIGGTTPAMDGQFAGSVCAYSTAKDAAWVATQYLLKAKAVQFKTDWSFQESVAAEGGAIGQTVGGDNSPIRCGDTTGRWKIVTSTVNKDSISKVLICTTAGNVVVPTSLFFDTTPTEAAFGTFSLWLNPIALIRMSFIGSSSVLAASTGYRASFTAVFGSSAFELEEMAPASTVITEKSAGAFTAGGDVWMNFLVTRSSTGVFTSYIDGELVTGVTGGSNPVTDLTYTTSSHMIFELQVGDMISLGNRSANYALTKQLGVCSPL